MDKILVLIGCCMNYSSRLDPLIFGKVREQFGQQNQVTFSSAFETDRLD
jgi:hypothetical protein